MPKGVFLLSEKKLSKESLKDLYHESRQRVRAVLNLIGKVEPNRLNPLPDQKTFETISNLINSIMSAAQFEPQNQYRDAIVEISDWLNCAFDKNYLKDNGQYRPHPLFIIKRGVEILHSFLHRDLRRKQFSSEEDQIYRSFLTTLQTLPDPRKVKMEQDAVDDLIDDLLKSG